jgi:hypothetical protein
MIARSPCGSKSSALALARKFDDLPTVKGVKKSKNPYCVFVCDVFATLTTIGTTVETTIGATPGANPTPKAAKFTASRAGEA